VATRKQIEANRMNAQRSTGPRTDDGKATSRMNAIRHGILSETPVVPHLESKEDWEDHRRELLESLQPIGRLEEVLAERFVETSWRVRRVMQYERDEVAKAYSPDAPRYWRELEEVGVAGGRQLPDLAKLGPLVRYEAHLHRGMMQLLREFQRVQDRRRGGEADARSGLGIATTEAAHAVEVIAAAENCETNPMPQVSKRNGLDVA